MFLLFLDVMFDFVLLFVVLCLLISFSLSVIGIMGILAMSYLNPLWSSTVSSTASSSCLVGRRLATHKTGCETFRTQPPSTRTRAVTHGRLYKTIALSPL